jgi:hypothetical protein
MTLMPDTPEKMVEKIEALYAKATPGPWKYGRRNDDVTPASLYHEKSEGHAYAVMMSPRYGLQQFKKDSAFVAALVDAWPTLKQTIERLTADKERLERLATCGCGDSFTEHDPGTCGNCACAQRVAAEQELTALRERCRQMEKALREYLDANEAWAKAQLTLNVAEANYSDSKPEKRALSRALTRASAAEKAARAALSQESPHEPKQEEGKS